MEIDVTTRDDNGMRRTLSVPESQGPLCQKCFKREAKRIAVDAERDYETEAKKCDGMMYWRPGLRWFLCDECDVEGVPI